MRILTFLFLSILMISCDKNVQSGYNQTSEPLKKVMQNSLDENVECLKMIEKYFNDPDIRKFGIGFNNVELFECYCEKYQGEISEEKIKREAETINMVDIRLIQSCLKENSMIDFKDEDFKASKFDENLFLSDNDIPKDFLLSGEFQKCKNLIPVEHLTDFNGVSMIYLENPNNSIIYYDGEPFTGISVEEKYRTYRHYADWQNCGDDLCSIIRLIEYKDGLKNGYSIGYNSFIPKNGTQYNYAVGWVYTMFFNNSHGYFQFFDVRGNIVTSGVDVNNEISSCSGILCDDL